MSIYLALPIILFSGVKRKIMGCKTNHPLRLPPGKQPLKTTFGGVKFKVTHTLNLERVCKIIPASRDYLPY